MLHATGWGSLLRQLEAFTQFPEAQAPGIHQQRGENEDDEQ